MPGQIVTLDGSFGEGGGAIVRVALAVSTIKKTPFEVSAIRSGRCNPGLKNQHLYCIKALESLCNAKTEGREVGSTSLKYFPGELEARNLDLDIVTAGSITLVLQSLLLPCVFIDKPIKIRISGGTDTKWSQPVDYFRHVLVPQLARFADIDFRVLKRGYYPKGGGIVETRITPKYRLKDSHTFEDFFESLKKNSLKFNLTEQGNLLKIKIISHASRDLEKASVAERQSNAAKEALKKLGCAIEIQDEYCNTASTGSGITCVAIFSKCDEIDFKNPIVLGADSLGERGKKAEVVGEEAAKNLLQEIESGAPVDKHLGDNLIPFLIFGGQIKVSEITDHLKTNIYVVQKFLGKMFEIDGNVIKVK